MYKLTSLKLKKNSSSVKIHFLKKLYFRLMEFQNLDQIFAQNSNIFFSPEFTKRYTLIYATIRSFFEKNSHQIFISYKVLDESVLRYRENNTYWIQKKERERGGGNLG